MFESESTEPIFNGTLPLNNNTYSFNTTEGFNTTQPIEPSNDDHKLILAISIIPSLACVFFCVGSYLFYNEYQKYKYGSKRPQGNLETLIPVHQ